MTSDVDHIGLLTALVAAYRAPLPDQGRQPLLLFKPMGGIVLQHHALGELPAYDEAALDELRGAGFLAYDDQGGGTILITPTAVGITAVEEHERGMAEAPVAAIGSLLKAFAAQHASSNQLAWPAVRPVLVALSDYWAAAGFSEHGVQLRPLLVACPDEQIGLVKATVRESQTPPRSVGGRFSSTPSRSSALASRVRYSRR